MTVFDTLWAMSGVNPRRRKVAWILAAVSAAVTLALWGVRWLEPMELSLYDYRLHGATAKDVDSAILPVPIEDYSVSKVGRFPWPRPVTGLLVQQLDKFEAKVVAGDILFGNPSYEAADDANLGEILASTDRVVLAYGSQISERVSVPLTDVKKEALDQFNKRMLPQLPLADEGGRYLPKAATVVLPIPEVVANIDMLGLTETARDKDGKMRRVPLVHRYGDHYLLSFNLIAAARYLNVPLDTIRVEPRRVILPAATMQDKVRDLVIPTNRSGEMWIRFYVNPAWFAGTTDGETLRVVTAADVILAAEGDEDKMRERVSGKIAIIYSSYSGNTDYHPTPRSKNYPGGLIHAEAINTMITGDFLVHPPWWVTVVSVLLFALAIALLGPRLSSFRMALFGLALFFGTMLAGVVVFRGMSYVVALVPNLLIIGLSTVSLLVYRTWIEDRERVDLMWTLQVLEKQALQEREQRRDAPTTIRGITEGSQLDDPTNALRRNIEYGRFIESLRELDKLPNTYIGKHYRLTKLIDEGGMGLVFLAEDEALGRIVAIKVLTKYSAKLLDRFKLEAKAVGQIDHENVVQVYAVASEGDIPYIVMEFVDGRSLSQKIRDEGPLDLYTAIKVLREIALGLDAAHCKNIIHRDIKTSNILIDENGTVKIIDFGIAKFFKGNSEQITGSREILGTADYMSPEQGAGKQLTHKTDIYSLGIVLYRTLTGRLPFRAEDTVAVLLKHMREPLPDLTKKRPDVPPTVIRILDRMTEKNPDDRYVDCQELASDLESVLRELNPTAAGDDVDGVPNLAGKESVKTG